MPGVRAVLNAYLTLIVASKEVAYFAQDAALSTALNIRWRQIKG